MQLVKVAMVYAGTVIGAGFASGQEIMQFFIAFGNSGLWGVGIAAALFTYLGMVLMALTIRLNTTSYKELLQCLLGKKLGRVMDVLSLLMLPGGLTVMLAGSGAVFAEQLGLSHFLGTFLAAFITCIVILGGIQGVLVANLILVPAKILFLSLVCLFVFFKGGLPRELIEPLSVNKVTGHWAWSSILYVSYNMIVPVAVLSSLGKTVSYKEGLAGGFMGGAILGVISFLVTLAGLSFYPEILNYEVPLLFIARQIGFKLEYMLGVMIWVAILTTAIADAHGFASRLAPQGGLNYKFIGIFTTLAAVPFAGLHFSHLVQVLYPVFGYAGLVLFFALLITPVTWFKKFNNT